MFVSPKFLIEARIPNMVAFGSGALGEVRSRGPPTRMRTQLEGIWLPAGRGLSAGNELRSECLLFEPQPVPIARAASGPHLSEEGGTRLDFRALPISGCLNREFFL